MVEVPAEFRDAASHPFPYPEDNVLIFEEWYYAFQTVEDARGRLYLPIFWTGYYIRAQYGQDREAIARLQVYLDSLDRTKKYYTIIQYDSGILNDTSHLDMRVFSMSGKPMHYPLPLICQPHRFSFEVEKDIFMSFIGRKTHSIRNKLIMEYEGHPECYVTDRKHTLEEYCMIMARSVYALCPRGFGPTSFRIMEALQYGTIPVYISDLLIFGHHVAFPGIGIATDQNFDPKNLLQALKRYPIPPHEIVKDIPEIFMQYYTYDATKRLILENLYHENIGSHSVAEN